MNAAVQLSFEAAGLDPHELAKLDTIDRGRLYDDLDLCPLQREAAEDAVRLIKRGEYLRGWR